MTKPLKLYWAPSSPFVRIVMIAAHELGIVDQIETQEATVENIVDLVSPANPLAQIPTLVTEDGQAIFDSANILTWLDETYDGSLCGRGTPARWAIAARQTVANGLMDAAVAARHLALQPEGHRLDSFIGRLQDRRQRTLAHLEKTLDPASGVDSAPVTADAIAACCALGYLDFRYPDEDWRSANPALADWFAAVSHRPSVAATAP